MYANSKTVHDGTTATSQGIAQDEKGQHSNSAEGGDRQQKSDGAINWTYVR